MEYDLRQRAKIVKLAQEAAKSLKAQDLIDYFEELHEKNTRTCDVKGCDEVPSSGGMCWAGTGYWNVCPKHGERYNRGDPQPEMKQEAIERENSRDKDTGQLSTEKE